MIGLAPLYEGWTTDNIVLSMNSKKLIDEAKVTLFLNKEGTTSQMTFGSVP